MEEKLNSFCFVENGGVATPKGFRAAGVTAKFKRSGALDFAALYSEVPANFDGVFTSCTFAAAPVRLCQKRVRESAFARLVIVNSGIANACTGSDGMAAAEKSCELAAAEFNVPAESVLCGSTGRIGVQLDMEKIADGVKLAKAAMSRNGSLDAAKAIMTTDTVPKSAAVELDIDGKKVFIGAMTKGAGMIDPHLVREPHATMLCYITTDAKLDNELIGDMLARGADNSFNRITVDGDMSTNDTVLLLANGESGAEVRKDTPEAEKFYAALLAVMQKLARMMAADGEGATKFVEVRITSAPSEKDARLCAEAVANSLLCKTAWFGGDPNWGRVVAALGYSGAKFDPDKVSIKFGEITVVANGRDAGVPESELADTMAAKELLISADLGSGDASYWVWTCDVSYEYVKINADYHT